MLAFVRDIGAFNSMPCPETELLPSLVSSIQDFLHLLNEGGNNNTDKLGKLSWLLQIFPFEPFDKKKTILTILHLL